MALRELLLELGVDVKDSDVKKADSALAGIKKAAIAAAAAFAAIKAVKGITGAIDDVRALGDEIDKTSQQLGLGVEELQEWRFAAGLAGVEGREMSNSLGRLQKNAFEAAKGNKTLAKDFERLGVNVNDAEGNLKNADTLLTEMADGFQGLTNDSEKVALSLNLMGRTGRKLLPLFKDGSAGIAEMRKEAQSLGGIMDQDLIDKTVQLTDDQFRAQMAWQGLKNQLAAKVIPIFIKFSNLMIRLAKALKGPLLAAFSFIENIIEGLVTIVEVAIGTFNELDNVFDKVTVGLGALGLAMLIFGRKAVATAIKTAASWALAALPFILIATLIAAAILLFEDLVVFFKGGDSLIGRLINSFKKWVRQMGGISGAVGKIFEKLFEEIFGLSDSTSRKIGGVFAALSEAIKFAFITIPMTVGQVFVDVFSWIKNFITKTIDVVVAAIDFLVDKLKDLVDIVADVAIDFSGIPGLDVAINAITGEDSDFIKNSAKSIRDEIEKGLSGDRGSFLLSTLGQLEKEKLGIAFTGGAGRLGAGAGDREMLNQILSQDDNSITVNVDATGQTGHADIAKKTASEVSRVNKGRQTTQRFQTSGT